MCLVDAVQSRLLLKGLPLSFSRDRDRRFCKWTQYNSPARRLINPDLENQGGRYPTKRLEASGSLGKRKGQPDRYPYPSLRCRKVRILFRLLRIPMVLIAVINVRNDFAFKKNGSLSDVTRNLRNFRPTFELREQWLYNNQV